MSYDISLHDPITKEIVILDKKHQLRGGTYALDGTDEAWLNITYNYSNHFKQMFGEAGIRTIYGMTATESIPLIEEAIKKLGNDINSDYWKSTEGNAKFALSQLLALAYMAPNGIWDGD